MICYLKGNIIQKQLEFIVLDVNGVGYEVMVPTSILATLPNNNCSVELYISTYIREDCFRLYGFLTMFDKKVFESLLDVSGIGPKVSIALLSAINGYDLCNLVISGQTMLLTKIPGIGAKSAERLVLELKTKFQKLLVRYSDQKLFLADSQDTKPTYQTHNSMKGHLLLEDLNSALQNMGYKEKQYFPIIDNIKKRLEYGEEPTFEDVLKESLKKLSERILKG